MSTSPSKDVRQAWHDRAAALAGHALSNLVNRADAWGGYLPIAQRTSASKSYTAPAKRLRGKRTLNHEILTNHFVGLAPEDIVGLHAISPQNTCRWGAVDIDRHAEHDDPAVNWTATLAWAQKLRDMDFDPLVMDSNGDGGFHIVVVFDAPVPADRVHHMMRRLVRVFAKHGLKQRPETFPKRPSVAPGKYGTWLRLPGRHHTRDHFTRVWDGSDWREGDYAIDLILGSRPDDALLVQSVPPKPSFENPIIITVGNDEQHDRDRGERPRMAEREIALACADHIDNAGEGLHYDDWISAGMALHTVGGDLEMRDAWCRLSRQSTKHVEGACQEKWSSFSNSDGEKRFTVGTLVHLARQSGFDPYPAGKGRAS